MPETPATTIRRRVRVSGKVQGVWFRDSCQREARRREVAGWVRNLADGRLEAVLEGPPDDVNELANWCRLGPPRARVTGIEMVEEPPEGLAGFRIVR